MKTSIISTGLVSALFLGLSACGGGGNDSPLVVTKFDGTWQGDCEVLPNSRSFKQKWKIDGTNLGNDISAWLTSASCQGAPTLANGIAKVEYQNEVNVANTCVGGKAQEVELTYISLKIGGATIPGESRIKSALAPFGVSLPKYNIICLDDNGKLHGGKITSDKDGSTPAKRPTEIDPVKSFTP